MSKGSHIKLAAALGVAYHHQAASVEPETKVGTPTATQGPPADPPYQPGGDDGGGHGPYDGGMEQRVAALEGFASDAKEKLTRIETKLEHIEKEVSNFKWWVVAQIAAGFIAVIGTGVAIQQMTVATFQAAGAQASPPQQAQPPIIINVPGGQAAAAAPQPTARAK